MTGSVIHIQCFIDPTSSKVIILELQRLGKSIHENARIPCMDCIQKDVLIINFENGLDTDPEVSSS